MDMRFAMDQKSPASRPCNPLSATRDSANAESGKSGTGRSCKACRFLLGLSVLSFCVVGCTSAGEWIHNGFKVGPNYTTPTAAVADKWIDDDDIRIHKDEGNLAHWWTVFNDPALNGLIGSAYRQDLALKEAAWRVIELRSHLGYHVGDLFPQTQVADGSFQQTDLSRQIANAQVFPQPFFPQWNYGFALSWEIDFWGRLRRKIEFEKDQLDATVHAYDDVLVTLLSDVATSYVEMRISQQEIAYLQENIRLQKDTLELAKERVAKGETSAIDVDQAQSTLTSTEAKLPHLQTQVRRANNKLCFLLGMPSENMNEKLGVGPVPSAQPDVAVGIPCDLLRQRPDVRQAERHAAAQCTQIGIAEADFYPAFFINGTVGYSAQQYSELYTPLAFTGTVGPSFQWNILNYGRILHSVKIEKARFQETILHYQQTVLHANEEVEDGLVGFLNAQKEVRSYAASVEADRSAVARGLDMYKRGQLDFNTLTTLEQNLAQHQDSLARSRGDIALGLIDVYRALGGGWQLKNEEPQVVNAW
jgi:NodT family efflux transporter outer membrane factor (OMF) lipoprotein